MILASDVADTDLQAAAAEVRHLAAAASGAVNALTGSHRALR
jgi:hypothetical protein